jgi:predicted ATPase
MCEVSPVYCGFCLQLHPDMLEQLKEHCEDYMKKGYCYVKTKGSPVYKTDSECRLCP